MNGPEVQQVGHVEGQNAQKSNESTFFRSKLARDLSPRRLCEPLELDAKLRTELPALFKLGGSLEALRPQKVSKECDDRKGASKPRLLQQLECFLEDKLRTAETMAAQMGAMQDGWAAQTLRLDAYRQTFEAFVNSFSTYKGLLLKVKKEYDKVLEDSLHVSYEHSTMKGELARAEERHNVAVRNAQTEAAASAANLKQRLTERIAEMERRGADAQAKAHELELEAVTAREQAIAHDKVTQQLIIEQKELKRTLLDQSSWAGKIRSV